jgi:NAD(P)H dehydrogenase (quinone)
MSIVITGATGQLGHLVVEELLARGVSADRVVATGRALDKVADLAARGVRTAYVDYDDPSTLDATLEPGDVLLLIASNSMERRVEQHRAVVDAAKRAGVAHLLYTSALSADDTPLILAPDHVKTEIEIRDSGIPFTLLRNGWYTENYVQALEQASATGVLLTSVGDGRVASATRADFAAATAAVLTTDGHEGKVYELSGDVAWDYDDLAAAFAEVLGRDVRHHRASPAEHLEVLTGAGLDQGTAGFLVALDGNIRDGALALQTGDLSRLAGRPSTSLVDGLRPFVAAK